MVTTLEIVLQHNSNSKMVVVEVMMVMARMMIYVY